VVHKKWELGMRAHFLSISCTITAVFVVCVLCFLFQNKLKTYVLYNPEEFLEYFPSEFCDNSLQYAEMSIWQRESCASKLSDKCFEIMATVGIFCLVGVIVGLLTIFTSYSLLPSDRLITPLTVLFSLLIGAFNLLVVWHSVDILKEWPEMMGLVVGGLQFESVVISALVSAGVVLFLSIFTGWIVMMIHTRDDDTDQSIKRVTVSITLQATAALLVLAIAIVTISLVKQMEPHVVSNFDRGDHISSTVNSLYCNRDSASYETIVCNELVDNKLRYYKNDTETATNGECLERSECVTKLVTALKASGSMLGFFMLCEFFYTLCIITWLFRFLNKVKGEDGDEELQVANLHTDEADQVDSEYSEDEEEIEDAAAVLQQEVALQEKIRSIEEKIREAVVQEHYMQAATLKEERDKYQLIQNHQQSMYARERKPRPDNPFAARRGADAEEGSRPRAASGANPWIQPDEGAHADM